MTTIADFMERKDHSVRHITLIDPGKQSSEVAAGRAVAAVAAGSSMIFVGGSTDTPNEVVHETCLAIQQALEGESSNETGENKPPVVLFPGGAHALSPAADGILFMMLMNSTDARFLIGEQANGAPYIEQFGIEPIPSGYIVAAPGGEVGRVGSADLIEPDQIERVYQYALAAKMYGFRVLYLEAGSGAHTPVSVELIQAAKRVEGLTLVVGGGLRTPADVSKAAEAGADWVVTGTITEEEQDYSQLGMRLSEMISVL